MVFSFEMLRCLRNNKYRKGDLFLIFLLIYFMNTGLAERLILTV